MKIGRRMPAPILAALVASVLVLSVVAGCASSPPPSASGAVILSATSEAPRGSLAALVVAPAKSIRVPILTYHDVDSRPVLGPRGGQLTVSPAQFRAEMDYLKRAGYRTVTLEQVYKAASGKAVLPPKSVALTFDDGGIDNYTVVYPILRSHGFVATFFIVGGFPDLPGHTSWPDIKLMLRSGMCIESHTSHHRDLTTLTDRELVAELAGARDVLRKKLGIDAHILAYPGGKYDARVEAAARAAGYVAAVTVRRGNVISLANAYEWPRIGIGPFTGLTSFRAALTK